ASLVVFLRGEDGIGGWSVTGVQTCALPICRGPRRCPLLRATDSAEDLVRGGVPFRDAHEQVAAEVRAGTFEPPDGASPRFAPGPSDVLGAVAAARARPGI